METGDAVTQGVSERMSDTQTVGREPVFAPPTLRDALIAAGIHVALARYAVWAAGGGRAHWLARASFTAFAAIFAVQAVAVLTRNGRLIHSTWEGGLARAEPVVGAGLVAASVVERRWPLAAVFGLSSLLLTWPRTPVGSKGVALLLFFGSWLPYRLRAGHTASERIGDGVVGGGA
jgi:hypothetical protein